MSAIFALHPYRWIFLLKRLFLRPVGRKNLDHRPARLTRMPRQVVILIPPGVASLRSVSKPIGSGVERLRLTLRSLRYRLRTLHRIRRFMLPLVLLNLRQQPMRISPSRLRSAETLRRVKTHEWLSTCLCLRLQSRLQQRISNVLIAVVMG